MTQRNRWIVLLGVSFLAAVPGLAGDERTPESVYAWEREGGNRDGEHEMRFKFTGSFGA